MPLYRYACPVCRAQQELLRKLGQDETDGLPPCPRCGEPQRMLKQVTAASFDLKGVGVYAKGTL